MKVVADSSPLILLSKTGYFDLLKNLYQRIHISGEVYAEVVVMGAGLPGASKVAKADWIEVKQLQKPGDLTAARSRLRPRYGRAQHDPPRERDPGRVGVN